MVDKLACICDGNCPMTEDRHWTNCPAHAYYAGYLAMIATPANGEQVERALPWQTVGECAEWIERTRNRAFLNGARHEDISRAEAVVLMSRLATLSTPTEDARERVKVLEEAGGLFDNPNATVIEDGLDGFYPVAVLRGSNVYVQQQGSQLTMDRRVAEQLAMVIAPDHEAWSDALTRIERVMRENIHENNGPDRIMLDGEWHEGPLAAWAIRCFRKVGEIARTALGNKETDRHG